MIPQKGGKRKGYLTRPSKGLFREEIVKRDVTTRSRDCTIETVQRSEALLQRTDRLPVLPNGNATLCGHGACHFTKNGKSFSRWKCHALDIPAKFLCVHCAPQSRTLQLFARFPGIPGLLWCFEYVNSCGRKLPSCLFLSRRFIFEPCFHSRQTEHISCEADVVAVRRPVI